MDYSLQALLAHDGFDDGCGRIHTAGIRDVLIGAKTVEKLPEMITKFGGHKAFLLADAHTYAAAGARVCSLLDAQKIPYSLYVLSQGEVEPDEMTAGSIAMHYDVSCDIVVGIGSGVINDMGKLIAAVSDHPYIIVATAPSMDGFASATSSVSRDGLKVSLPTKGANCVIGDTEILAAAPARMLAAGVGDMIAKYISLTEWKLAHIIVGEYYCQTVCDIVNHSLQSVVSHAEGLAKREPAAIEAVMEGMVLAGIAMNYADMSRPASGVEHYFSHVWDMRHLEFGASCPADLHGIQCGVATLLSLRVYEQIKALTPDREKAKAHAAAFDCEVWFTQMRRFLGRGAESMIAAETEDGKYNVVRHAERLEVILAHWDEIVAEIDKMPTYDDVKRVLETVGAPTTAAELGHDEEVVRMSLLAAKDIRDKYVASRLLWDLGELDGIITDSQKSRATARK